jgi:molecular chaperone HscB
MTYFELFEIPVQLKVDKATLPHKYFELSRKYHPDFFVNASNTERNEALEKSALLNQAFRTFQNQDETIKYVLKLKGLLEEEEKYNLPPAFLMEVLEINEAMMDIDEKPVKEKLKTMIDNLQNEIYASVREIVENYKDEITTRDELLKVKEYYFKKKYIDRIQQQLQS